MIYFNHTLPLMHESKTTHHDFSDSVCRIQSTKSSVQNLFKRTFSLPIVYNQLRMSCRSICTDFCIVTACVMLSSRTTQRRLQSVQSNLSYDLSTKRSWLIGYSDQSVIRKPSTATHVYEWVVFPGSVVLFWRMTYERVRNLWTADKSTAQSQTFKQRPFKLLRLKLCFLHRFRSQ